MKTFVLTLFLYFALFAPGALYAGSNTIIASYPAPSGSYNKLVLQNLQASVTCTSANNGMLYMDTVGGSATNTLQLCANGKSIAVPYPETCFNRFCSCTNVTSPAPATYCTGTCQPPSAGAVFPSTPSTPCPAGYTQANIPVLGNQYDSFPSTDDPTNTTVYSIVCCSSPSTVLP